MSADTKQDSKGTSGAVLLDKAPAAPELEAPAVAKRICIVGFTEHRAEAPWNDPGWGDIWICNDLYRHVPDSWTRLYDLHDHDTIAGDKAHAAFLADADALKGRQVVTWQPRPDWPTAVQYPREQVQAALGGYFTNSISWMIAHAMYEWRVAGYAPDECELWVVGVDMAVAGEYCVSPETRVLTADLRWVPAEQIKVGDELVAFDEEPRNYDNGSIAGYRHYVKATVERADELVRPCYRLLLEDGTKLVSSQEHRWLGHAVNQHAWRRTDKLVTPQHRKDRPSRLVKLFDTWDTDDSRDGGYLAAAFDGEGHLSMKQRLDCNGTSVTLGFAQRDNAMAEQVKQALIDRGFDVGNHMANGCRKYSMKGGRSEIVRFLGTVRPHRLLDLFDADLLGVMHKKDTVAVVESEYIGEQTVIGLKTSAGTFVAEGFASHNSGQRPSCEYFIGLAVGMGIKVHVPTTSDLLKTAALYGVESDHPLLVKMKMRARELEQRLAQTQQQLGQIDQQRGQAVAAVNQLQGALESVRYTLSWFPPEASRDGKVQSDDRESML